MTLRFPNKMQLVHMFDERMSEVTKLTTHKKQNTKIQNFHFKMWLFKSKACFIVCTIPYLIHLAHVQSFIVSLSYIFYSSFIFCSPENPLYPSNLMCVPHNYRSSFDSMKIIFKHHYISIEIH